AADQGRLRRQERAHRALAADRAAARCEGRARGGEPVKHLLGIENRARSDIELILETSEAMLEISQREVKRVPTLRGRTVINVFLESSTRTRVIFEIAAKRLSGDASNAPPPRSSPQ